MTKLKLRRVCIGCGGDTHHYAGCAYGEHGEKIKTQAELVAELRSIDLLHGIHSGIPRCCVDEFVAIHVAWGYSPEASSAIIAENRRKKQYAEEFNKELPNYVMCWTCVYLFCAGELTPATVHICKKDSKDPVCQAFIRRRDEARG